MYIDTAKERLKKGPIPLYSWKMITILLSSIKGVLPLCFVFCFCFVFYLLCLSLSLADHHLSQKWEERKSSFTTMAVGSAKIEDSNKNSKIHCTLDCFFRHTKNHSSLLTFSRYPQLSSVSFSFWPMSMLLIPRRSCSPKNRLTFPCMNF